MNLANRLLLIFTLIFGFSINAYSQSGGNGPGVRDVEVLLFMIDIDEVDSVAQSFTGTVYAELKWSDPSLAHEGPDSASRPLSEIWYPHTQILNQQRLTDTFPKMAEIRPNGDVIYRQRVWGDFSQPLELRHFPFDQQRLQITLVNVAFGSTRVRYLVSPESGVARSLKIPDWKVLSWDISTSELPIGSQNSNNQTVVLSLDVERHNSYFTLKVILPLIMIVAMSWMVFWIDPSLAASQISVAVTAMLTLIAYRFAIGGMVPRLGFLTSLDYFVMGSTILVFIGLLEVVYTYRLYHAGKHDLARKVDAHARWVVPTVYLLIVLETLYFRIGI